MFTERVLINPSEAVTIGDDVAMGSDVQVWTHGSFLDVMAGFPATFGPVTVGESCMDTVKKYFITGNNNR